MVLPPQEPGALVREWQNMDKGVLTTLDPNTEEGFNAYMACLTASTKLAKHCVGQPLPVVDWLLHEAEYPDDETGEVRYGLRLVFVLADGSTVSTGSNPLISNWGHVCKRFGTARLDPPLTIVLRAVKARGAGEYLQIASVSRNTTPGTKGKNAKG